MMRPTLRYKINSAILITFIVISLVFIFIQALIQNHHSQSVAREIEVLLQMVVEREQEALANEIYQDLPRALILRLDRIREKGNIILISVFDSSGRLLVSRGDLPETPALSEAQMAALSGGLQIRNELRQGLFSMVYMQQIEIIGEKIGFIRICYSLDFMKREQQKAWGMLGGLLGAILVVMLIVMNLIMSRTIVKPILALSGYMGRMQAGKFEKHETRNRRDEIGDLSTAFNTMARDLTASYREVDLKKSQLQAAQQYLVNVIDSMPSILLGVDETLMVTQWNLQAQKATGIRPEEAVGKPLPAVLPQISGTMTMVHQALRERAFRKAETVQWTIEGKPVYVDITIYPLVTDGSREAVVRVDDVTDRMHTQEALRESQEKYRLVVEYANDAILILQDGVIVFANQKTTALAGYCAEELASMHFINFVSEEDRELCSRHYIDRLYGKSAPANYSFRIRHKSGKQLWINNNSVLISWNGRPATLNFLRDITDIKKTEEQLLHAQKMDAVGTLAGGIAHDFNNLLQVIQGYTQLLLLGKKDRKNIDPELESILRAARKGGELTMQLLTFGRKVENHPKIIDINAQIEKIISMLSRAIPKMIHIELQLAPEMPSIYVDPGQMEQVVMNLVINARDAMQDSGHILIRTNSVTLDEDDAERHMLPASGQYICLSISDTGHGITNDVLAHIFEPFFTTKKLGDGTGLGLAIVYGIVKNHNGSILCESVPEEGTRFSVYFPAASTSPAPVPETKTASAPEPVKGGTETLLLVDDEETLQDIGRQLLEKFGYTVVTAASAEEALEVYAGQPERFHLVILDLVMPGMGGKKCIDALIDLNPAVKIVIASGYLGDSGKGIDTKSFSNKIKGFIKKPFVLESMLREIRRILDHRQR